MKKTLSLKIFTQTLITLFLIFVIILLAVWSYNEAREELVSNYSSYTLAVARNNANKIEEEFRDLTLLFDYLAETIKVEGVKEETLRNPYFQKAYSSIAEEFIVFDNKGNILCFYCERIPLIDPEQLTDIFVETLKEEAGKPTPRLSEFKNLKVRDGDMGIFMFFDKLLYGPEKKEVYMTFIISGERILDTYIKPLRLANKEGYAYIIDDDKIVVASGKEKHIGKELDEIEDMELRDLLLKHEGKSEREIEEIKATFAKHRKEEKDIFNKMVTGAFGTERYLNMTGDYKYELVSFYPIPIPGDSWSFAIKTPYSYVVRTLKGNFERTATLTVMFIFILFLDFTYIIYNFKKRLKAEFEVNHVSDMLEKELAVRKAQYKFKQLYQNTKDIILICDNKFLIEEINNAGVKSIGKNIKNITHKMKFQDRFINEAEFTEFTSILSSGRSVVDFETEINIDGKTEYFTISADKHFDEAEKRDLIHFVIRDISEHKKLQEEIINKEKLESAMALIVTANHEINNPLAGIVLNTELVKKTIKSDGEEVDGRVSGLIDSINEEAYRISSVLKKLGEIEEIREKEYADATKMLDIDMEKLKNG
jgi:PAS domain S-box-containing protein